MPPGVLPLLPKVSSSVKWELLGVLGVSGGDTSSESLARPSLCTFWISLVWMSGGLRGLPRLEVVRQGARLLHHLLVLFFSRTGRGQIGQKKMGTARARTGVGLLVCSEHTRTGSKASASTVSLWAA